MSEPHFGLVAEDPTDGDTIRVIAQRILKRDKVSLRYRADHGSSTLKRKAEAWIAELVEAGCDHIIILHDLDRGRVTLQLNDEVDLYRLLDSFKVPTGVPKLICIPIEELEAWFWACPKVVQLVGRGSGKAHPSPDRIRKPKEALQRLSRDAGGKPRYSTNENKRLADVLDIDKCETKCRSFAALRSFIEKAAGIRRPTNKEPMAGDAVRRRRRKPRV